MKTECRSNLWIFPHPLRLTWMEDVQFLNQLNVDARSNWPNLMLTRFQNMKKNQWKEILQVAVKNSHWNNFMIHLKNSNNCWNEPFCACSRSISVCNCVLWWNQIKHGVAVIWKVHLLRWKAKFYFFAHISSFFEQKAGTSKEIYKHYADDTIVCVWRGQVHYTWVSWASFTFFTLGAITIYWQRPTWIDLLPQRPTSWHFVGFGPKKQVNAT